MVSGKPGQRRIVTAVAAGIAGAIATAANYVDGVILRLVAVVVVGIAVAVATYAGQRLTLNGGFVVF
jgi:hypothetical protein